MRKNTIRLNNNIEFARRSDAEMQSGEAFLKRINYTWESVINYGNKFKVLLARPSHLCPCQIKLLAIQLIHLFLLCWNFIISCTLCISYYVVITNKMIFSSFYVFASVSLLPVSDFFSGTIIFHSFLSLLLRCCEGDAK